MSLQGAVEISASEIPQEILAGIPYPEFIGTLGKQKKGDSCGAAVASALARARLGLPVSEKTFLEREIELYGQDGITPPEKMVNVTRHIIHDSGSCPFPNFFMTNNGNSEQLRELTERGCMPVGIHRIPIAIGHFQVVLGTLSEEIYFHDSYEERAGFYRASKRTFHEELWPVQNGRITERWYIAVVPKEIILPRARFKGRYM